MIKGIILEAVTNYPTSGSTVLLEKLTVRQLAKKYPAFCGNRKFITSSKTARHLSLPQARSVQSKPSQPRSVLILSSHLRLGLPSGTFHSGISDISAPELKRLERNAVTLKNFTLCPRNVITRFVLLLQ